jgi:hypothetical protein
MPDIADNIENNPVEVFRGAGWEVAFVQSLLANAEIKSYVFLARLGQRRHGIQSNVGALIVMKQGELAIGKEASGITENKHLMIINRIISTRSCSPVFVSSYHYYSIILRLELFRNH